MRQRILIGLAAMAMCVACRDVAPTLPAIDSTEAVSIDIRPAAALVPGNVSIQFTATVRDLAGRVVGTAPVAWASTNAQAVAVDGQGLAVTHSVGSTTVTAMVIVRDSALADTAVVSVMPFSGSFGIWPDTNALPVGSTRALVSRTIQAVCPLRCTDSIAVIGAQSWSSSNPGTVSVDSHGVITGLATGKATITASLSDGRTAMSEVFVVPGAPLRFGPVFSTLGWLAASQDLSTLEIKRAGCGLAATDGSLYCWGDFGALWNESRVAPFVGPAPLPDSYVQAFDRCEQYYRRDQRQVVDRTRCAEAPVQFFSGTSFTSLGGWSCGLSSTGVASCWGSNVNGELGIGTTDAAQHAPTPLLTAEVFRSLYSHWTGSTATGAASRASVTGTRCGLRADGAAFCWGIGFGSTPTQMKGTVAWRLLAQDGPCGIATDSTAWCWSGNNAPAQVGGTMKWTDIVIAFGLRCALNAAGRVYCWRKPSASGAPLIEPPVLVGGEPPLIAIGGEIVVTSSFRSPRLCGLSAAGDMYCVVSAGADSTTTFSLQPRNLGGLKLKRFSGYCGVGFDDKTYCWSGDASPVVTVLPRQ